LDEDWALKVTQHQRKVYSQGAQDGSLEYIFRHIGVTNKKYVEFGFSNNDMEGGTGPNTRLLSAQGWSGVLLDGSHENPAINLSKLWILPETIVAELRKRGVENGTDYISIDMDSSDCFVMERVACELQPRVMTVEYNSNYPFEATIANVGKDYMWKDDRFYGCGIGVHGLIAEKCGYTIVDVIARLDVVLVRNDIFRDTKVHPMSHWKSFASLPFHYATRLEEQDKFLCDYSIYMKTRDLKTCMGKPVRDQLKRLNYDLKDYWYIPWVPSAPW
jgi:hypothetical protein